MTRRSISKGWMTGLRNWSLTWRGCEFKYDREVERFKWGTNYLSARILVSIYNVTMNFKNSKINIGKLTPSLVNERVDTGWNAEMEKRINTLESLITKRIEKINGLVSRNGGRGLIGIFMEYIRGIRPRTSKSVVRLMDFYTVYCDKRIVMEKQF